MFTRLFLTWIACAAVLFAVLHEDPAASPASLPAIAAAKVPTPSALIPVVTAKTVAARLAHLPVPTSSKAAARAALIPAHNRRTETPGLHPRRISS